ncbi:MAG: protein kinase domain-containing protein [Bradymonadaceae bacterium]
MSNRGAANEATQVQRVIRERRRREYRTRLPDHHCGECTSVLYAEDESCLECEAPRPDEGWRALCDQIDPWLGRVLDSRYLIVKELGKGSSASVYQAESLSISRRFAIKTIATGHGQQSEQIVARLNREIEALGRLRNPHIVSFYEILEIQDKYVAAVMDLIDGDTLEVLINNGGPVGVGRACALTRQIANGVFEAHQAGMIHRDLKPENLMVEQLPAGDDFVHILDFGIVRMSGGDSVAMTHGFIGTPLYASPEQAMASAIDHRSDIYSLGAILFFMLTGRPPFLSQNVYEVLKMHVRTPAPRLGEVQPNILYPESLEALVRSMLAKTPEQRPSDLSEVIEELDNITSENYSDAKVHVAATQARPAINPNSTDPGAFDREETDSSATIQGFTRREPAETPQFVRAVTGSRVARPLGMELIPLPGEISYSVVTEDKESEHSPQKAGRVQTACASHGVFGVLYRGEEEIDVFTDADEEPRKVKLPHLARIMAMALTRRHLITGHEDGTVGLVQLSTGKRSVLFQDVRRTAITAVASDPLKSCIVAGSKSGRIYVKDARHDWTRFRSGKPVIGLAMNEGADTVAVAHDDKSLEVLAVANPRTPVSTFVTPALVRSMAISSDNHLLAAALSDGSVIVYHMLTGKAVMTLTDMGRALYALDFSQGNTPRALCERDGKLCTMTLEQMAARA